MQNPDQTDPRTPQQDEGVEQVDAGMGGAPPRESEEQPSAAETFDEEGAGIAAKE
jgi:hypothetical protein